MLTNALMEYVKEKGVDCTEYEINQFGLDFDDGSHVTKVLNFYDAEGCYFTTERQTLPDDINYDTDFDGLCKQIDDRWFYWAIQCLYIEVDEDGEESLCYYALWNTGAYFSDALSQPEHEKVNALPLDVLENIILVIDKTEEYK